MTSMGYISVIVNIALLSVSGAIYELLPQMSTAQSILLLVVVEHCIYVLYYTLSSLIPDTPSSVMQQLAVLEYRRREALRTLERESMREYKRQRSTSKSQQDNGLEEDKPTE
ncbi:unnamed protein product [Dicrocoelium dendriticum]|nr:unnamed protein product [Dicrocoelium dendriticum]